MKKKHYTLKNLSLAFFLATLFATILFAVTPQNIFTRFNYKPNYNQGTDEFDTTLTYLNSIEKIKNYCDSVYATKYNNLPDTAAKKNYSEIVDDVLRKRFYHGYSYYTLSDNYLLYLFSRFTKKKYDAIILPNDILKQPMGACSQQSIIMMQLLKRKNIDTREVGFVGKTDGHFALEVLYDSTWHFYDTDLEPNKNLLLKLGRPSIASIAKDTNLILQAYNNHPQSLILDVIPNYFYGLPNTNPAPRGSILQQATKFLSKTIWILFGVLFLVLQKNIVTPKTKE